MDDNGCMCGPVVRVFLISKIREKYDFTEGLDDDGEDAHSELLERRAALMKKYLENYIAVLTVCISAITPCWNWPRISI